MAVDSQVKRRATLVGLTPMLPPADGAVWDIDRAILAVAPVLSFVAPTPITPTWQLGIENPNAQSILLVDWVGAREPKVWTEESSGSDTFYADTPREVVRVDVDGAQQTEYASLAALLDSAVAAGWFWDYQADRIYVRLADSNPDAYAVHIQTFIVVHVSTKEKVLDDVPYEERLKEGQVPPTKMDTPAKLGGKPKLASGGFQIVNEDSALDGLEDVDWDAGWINLRLGFDGTR